MLFSVWARRTFREIMGYFPSRPTLPGTWCCDPIFVNSELGLRGSYSTDMMLSYLMVTGLFAPKTIRSRERKFQVWNFRSLELSLPGTFSPRCAYLCVFIFTVRSRLKTHLGLPSRTGLDLLCSTVFHLWYTRAYMSRERKFQGAKVPRSESSRERKFHTLNFRSRERMVLGAKSP